MGTCAARVRDAGGLPRPLHAGCAALLALAALLFGTAGAARAQTGRVSIELDKHIAAVGEEVQVTVSIEVEGTAGYSRFIPPAFSDFRVSSGGMTSQNIQMINWQVRRTESHTYSVQPLKEGVLTVGPAAVVLGGRMIRSGTVSLRVKKAVPGATPAPGLPDQIGPPPELPPGRALPSVFIAAVATPQKVFVGQEVVCVWSLFTLSDVLGFQPLRQPTTDNFWSEDLHSPQRLEFERRMVQDRVYYAAVLARKALFPQKPGKLRIGAMEAQVRTLENFASAALSRQSEELVIEVQPLPREGRPPGFADTNVGQFELWGSLDRGSVRAGDAVTLKLVVRGTGNLSQLKLPPLTELAGFKVYEPKFSDKLSLEERVQGEKTVEYLLMPVRGGRLSIPPIHLDFFDPVKASYQRVSTTPLSLMVTGELPAAGKSDGKANVLGPGIRPPRPVGKLFHRGAEGSSSPLFWILLAVPAGLLLLLGAGERLRARLSQETPASLRRAAARRVRGRLRRAQEARRRGDASTFFGEIAAVLRTQLDQQMGVRSEGLTREELRQEMEQRGFPEELAEAVIRELDNCDFARFAPSASGDQQMSEAAQRVRQIVERIARVGGARAAAGRRAGEGPAPAERLRASKGGAP
jgi:hypothetical protein